MTKELARIRRKVSAHKPGRGRRYAADVRGAVVRYARRRREQGASWAAIADEVGLRFETVRSWCVRPDESTASIVPVEVVVETAASAPVVLVSPSGYRLEGLEPAEAVAALRALG